MRNLSEAKSLAVHFESAAVFNCVTCDSGREALEITVSQKAEFLLVDFMLSDMDGLGLVDKLVNGYQVDIDAVYLSPVKSQSLIDLAFRCGVCFCIFKPVAPKIIVERFLQIKSGEVLRFDQKKIEPDAKLQLAAKVGNIIRRIGIPIQSKGYSYLIYGVILMLDYGGNEYSMMTDIYERIAVVYNTNPANVERNMRGAIESAWKNGDVDYIDSLFYYSVSEHTGRPSNSAFICTIADRIFNMSIRTE